MSENNKNVQSEAGADQHSKVTLFERETGDPVIKLGEHGDQFRVTDGDLEEIRAVEVAELDEPWTSEELVAVEENDELPEPILEHFRGERT